jgi:hypothetical protein
LIVLGCAALSACGPKPEPLIPEATPTEVPLPPSSGTPIGILIDDATKLSLRVEQIDKLREIDDSLMARNDQLDARQRRYETLGVPASELRAARDKKGPGAGKKDAPKTDAAKTDAAKTDAAKADAAKAGAPVAAAVGASLAAPPPDAAATGGIDPSVLQRFTDEKEANTLAAIARALDVLDPDQRVIAEKLLDDRGVKRTPNAPAAPDGSGGTQPAVPYEP